MHNQARRCAGEIRRCSHLRELSLEANRLSAPVIDLRSLAQLRSLQLFGNPLDFLPELTPCSSLRHLSLANVSPLPQVARLPVPINVSLPAGSSS